MSYIGNKPATNFETVQKQISTSNSGTTITLDRAVTSVQDILLTIDAVVQSYDNYSVSGTTLTVGGTLSNNRVEILYVGRTMQSVDPTDDSISAAKIKTDAVTTAKIQNDAVTKDKVNFATDGTSAGITSLGDGTSSGNSGAIELRCSNNNHGVQLISPDHSASQSWKLKLPDNSPTADKFLKVKSITGSGSTATGQLEFADAGGDFVRLSTIDQDLGTSQKIQFTQVFSSDYDFYRLIGRANVGSNQQALIYFRWLNSSDTEQYSAEYHYAGYGRYSNTNDSGGNISWQKMGETDANLVTDFYGGSYSRTMFYDMTFYPKVNSSQDRSGFQGQISYNAYNSGNGGWNATSVGGTYNMDTDLSGGGLQIECNTSFDYVTMSLYGVKLT